MTCSIAVALNFIILIICTIMHSEIYLILLQWRLYFSCMLPIMYAHYLCCNLSYFSYCNTAFIFISVKWPSKIKIRFTQANCSKSILLSTATLLCSNLQAYLFYCFSASNNLFYYWYAFNFYFYYYYCKCSLH